MSKKQKLEDNMTKSINTNNEEFLYKHKIKKDNTNNKILYRTVSSYNINM